MKAFVAGVAVVAVAVLSLLAVWRALQAWGVLQGRDAALGPEVSFERTRLLDEKMRHLKTLKEIEFDHETGKIDVNDYRSLKRRHEIEAAAAIRALDALDALDVRAETGT